MCFEVDCIFWCFGVVFDFDCIIEGFLIVDQQIIEIVKVIFFDVSVFIMDELMVVFSGVEVECLFVVVWSLCDEGWVILFILYCFDEVFDLCDMVIVMCDGVYIDMMFIVDIMVDDFVCQMVGCDVMEFFLKQEVVVGELLFEVCGFISFGVFYDIFFIVWLGEIVVFVGFVGVGCSEVV